MRSNPVAVFIIIAFMGVSVWAMVKGFTEENYLRIFLALGGFAGFAWLLVQVVNAGRKKQDHPPDNDHPPAE